MQKGGRWMCNALIDVASAIGARFQADDGQTLTEYGMLVAFIAIVVVAAAIILGDDISSLFVPIVKDFL
jgi:Flp pilus assembly pilin Flp